MKRTIPPEARALVEPARLYSWAELVGEKELLPRGAGVYAWYFDADLPGVPTAGCCSYDGRNLLYVGIAPKRPSAAGKKSAATLRSRILRNHFGGNAAGSTLRLTLGCLLAPTLGLELRPTSSGRKLTFGKEGETRLTQWMNQHARVTWVEHPEPWDLEHALIAAVPLPLNLDQNRSHAFHTELSRLRREAKRRARGLMG
jgi:hypothetical protein